MSDSPLANNPGTESKQGDKQGTGQATAPIDVSFPSSGTSSPDKSGQRKGAPIQKVDNPATNPESSDVVATKAVSRMDRFKEAAGDFAMFVGRHIFTSLLFVTVLIAFILFFTTGISTKTYDSFNAQLVEYYTKGSIYYGVFSAIFIFFIIIIAVKQKYAKESSIGSERGHGQNPGFKVEYKHNRTFLEYQIKNIFANEEPLKNVKSGLYMLLFVTLTAMSYNLSMMTAYMHMNMDTENIPAWVFPMTTGLVLAIGLVIFIVHTISKSLETEEHRRVERESLVEQV